MTLLVLLQAAAPPAAAQEDLTRVKRGSLLLGAFLTHPDTSASFTATAGRQGTDIKLETDLGLEKSVTVARLGGYYWFSLRHRLDFSVFRYARDATHVLENNIEFGDQTFSLNTEVMASSDVTILQADYTYSPIVRERGNFGITAGIYSAKFDLAIRAVASGAEQADNVTAPLPVYGFRGQFLLTPRLLLTGVYQRFSLAVSDSSGTLNETYLGVDYSFNRRIALGLAYNLLTVNVRNEPDQVSRSRLDWGYDGFLLYLKANFGS